MVTLRVSRNILKRLMNIYIHQAAGNYTRSRYTDSLPFTSTYYLKIYYLLFYFEVAIKI